MANFSIYIDNVKRQNYAIKKPMEDGSITFVEETTKRSGSNK